MNAKTLLTKQRTHAILGLIKSNEVNGDVTSKQRIIGLLAYRWGLSMRSVWNYFQPLIAMGEIMERKTKGGESFLVLTGSNPIMEEEIQNGIR